MATNANGKIMKKILTIITIIAISYSLFNNEAEANNKKCLAEAIYHEARNQPFHGQIAIANVIRNRAKRKHKTFCAIIREPKQFSYRNNGIASIDDKVAYDLAIKAASVEQDLTGGAVYYNRVELGIRKGGHHPVTIGNHVFYRGMI